MMFIRCYYLVWNFWMNWNLYKDYLITQIPFNFLILKTTQIIHRYLLSSQTWINFTKVENKVWWSSILKSSQQFFLLSAFLLNCFLCWDPCNNDLTPTLDVALLCSSRAGSDLGRESRLVWGALSIGFPHFQVEVNASLKVRFGVLVRGSMKSQ